MNGRSKKITAAVIAVAALLTLGQFLSMGSRIDRLENDLHIMQNDLRDVENRLRREFEEMLEGLKTDTAAHHEASVTVADYASDGRIAVEAAVTLKQYPPDGEVTIYAKGWNSPAIEAPARKLGAGRFSALLEGLDVTETYDFTYECGGDVIATDTFYSGFCAQYDLLERFKVEFNEQKSPSRARRAMGNTSFSIHIW